MSDIHCRWQYVRDFAEDPSLIKEYDLTDFLEFIVGDVNIDSIGPINEITIMKEEEEENVN